MARPPSLHRTELLLGADVMDRLAATRVILFGAGGVGSYAAESLVRTGLGHLTVVDSDLVCVTNINRQVQATAATVGHPKAEALRARLLEIRPAADVVARTQAYAYATRDAFDLPGFDYVLDAIDSLSNKLGLIAATLAAGRPVLFSAMGAAAKLDPTLVRVASIWKTDRCRLARKIRKRLRRQGVRGDFLCVYSEERGALSEDDDDDGDETPDPTAAPRAPLCGSGRCLCPTRPTDAAGLVVAPDWCAQKAQINGSVMHVTATFGLFLAGLVVKDVVRRAAVAPA